MPTKKAEWEIKVGERIKQIRQSKGLSLTDVAERSGFSSALLSQIENHLVSPPLGTLVKLSKALDVEIGRFFWDTSKAPFTIVRKDERKSVSRVASKEGVKYGYSYESLAFDKKGRHMEPFFITLEPATIEDKNVFTHEGEEFIFVLEGDMEITLDEYTDVLHPGDCIYYDSTIPHRVQCREGKETKILAVIHVPTG
ncbi:MAG: cupin domain-containing protein [Pseudomonadota bacterium]